MSKGLEVWCRATFVHDEPGHKVTVSERDILGSTMAECSKVADMCCGAYEYVELVSRMGDYGAYCQSGDVSCQSAYALAVVDIKQEVPFAAAPLVK